VGLVIEELLGVPKVAVALPTSHPTFCVIVCTVVHVPPLLYCREIVREPEEFAGTEKLLVSVPFRAAAVLLHNVELPDMTRKSNAGQSPVKETLMVREAFEIKVGTLVDECVNV
jgi:hypothetical protein